jgi:CRP/FNR family transcriptional regulator, dissimilatory nitrate respiration regulator
MNIHSMKLENSVIEKLGECYLFKNLSLEEIELAFINKHFRIRNFESEQFAVQAGDICNDLPLLISGNIRGEMADYSGRVVKIEDIKAPAVLASAFIFGPENKFPVDIIANEPSTILFIAKESIIKIFQENHNIMLNFLNDISNRAQFLTKKIRFLAFKTIREKLAQYIVEMSRNQNSDVVLIPITQSKLADFFGVARPSLNRTIRELEMESIIKAERNQIIILNKQMLINLAIR